MDASDTTALDEVHALATGSPTLAALLVALGSTVAAWTVTTASTWLRGTPVS